MFVIPSPRVCISCLLASALPASSAEQFGPANAETTTRTLSVQSLSASVTAESMAQLLAGEGVTVADAVYTGVPTAAGQFGGGTDVFGFAGGVVLSTGRAGAVVGPNDSDSTTTQHGNACAGEPCRDADLGALLSGEQTFDAAILEFEIVPDKAVLFINYVFGSEEYNEFVGQEFNDVFGFFVNGENCALIEGQPVAVNSVNNGSSVNPSINPSNPEYYIDNEDGRIDIELDGMTIELVCRADVTPNTGNTLKLAIADVVDQTLDAAVFIRAAGISTDEPDSQPQPGDALFDSSFE